MKTKRSFFWLIIFITIVTSLIALPANIPLKINPPFTLGLDLQGGVSITFEADMKDIGLADRKDALESAKSAVERRVNSFGVGEPVIQVAKVGESNRIIVELPGFQDIDLAIRKIGATAQLSFWEYELKEDEATPSAKKTDLTGRDLKKASTTFDQNTGKPQVSLEFKGDGAKKFADITTRNVGKPVAILLDDQILSTPNVNEPILNGQAVIVGNFTVKETKELAKTLNEGALPVPLSILQQRTVGATLGIESIQKSLMAGIIGFGLVALFMILFYRMMGFLAILALIIYTLIVLTLFKLIPVTLTLAGIAGFILSIGMAVDANILIFERLKEEIKWGKPRHVALEAGFSRAWTSIRDSNISSLITCAILYYFGAGIVRGFALTLAIGILVSMFSAIIVTRTLLRMIYRG